MGNKEFRWILWKTAHACARDMKSDAETAATAGALAEAFGNTAAAKQMAAKYRRPPKDENDSWQNEVRAKAVEFAAKAVAAAAAAAAAAPLETVTEAGSESMPLPPPPPGDAAAAAVVVAAAAAATVAASAAAAAVTAADGELMRPPAPPTPSLLSGPIAALPSPPSYPPSLPLPEFILHPS